MATTRRPIPKGATRPRGSMRAGRPSLYRRVLDAGRTLVGAIARPRGIRAANDPEG